MTSEERRAVQGFIGRYRRPLIAGIAVVVLAFSVAYLREGFKPRPLPENVEPFEALGARAAEEAIQLAGGRGPLVLITWNRTNAFISGGALIMQAFMDTLAERPDIKIAGTEIVNISMELFDEAPPPALPCARYLAVLRKYPEAAAVVSFVGFPECNAGNLPAKRAPLLAIEVKKSSAQLTVLLRKGIADVVLTYKQNSANERAAWFDRYFQVHRTASQAPDGS